MKKIEDTSSSINKIIQYDNWNKKNQLVRGNPIRPMTVKVFVDEGLGIGIVSKSFIENIEDYHIYPVKPSISNH